jgi:hypothetical protein
VYKVAWADRPLPSRSRARGEGAVVGEARIFIEGWLRRIHRELWRECLSAILRAIGLPLRSKPILFDRLHALKSR